MLTNVKNIGIYLEVCQHTCMTTFSMSSTAWLHALLRHSQTRIVAAAASVTALVSTCSAVTPQTVWLEGGEDSGSSGSTTVSLGHRQRYASKQVCSCSQQPTLIKLKAHQAHTHLVAVSVISSVDALSLFDPQSLL